MKAMKYKLFPIEDVCIYPHKYECTISSGYLAPYDLQTRNDSLCCLPRMHPSQSLFGCSNNDKPFTMFVIGNKFRPLNLKWPNLKCHNYDWSKRPDLEATDKSFCNIKWNILFCVIWNFAISVLCESRISHASFSK